MDRRNPSHRQAALVVRVLPHVARREEFALKGGTAINLFLRDLPRLSVDIDLTYLPLTPREEALPAIRQGLDAVGTDLRAAILGIGALLSGFRLPACPGLPTSSCPDLFRAPTSCGIVV